MGSFDEFESADMRDPKIQKPKPEAPQIPTDPSVGATSPKTTRVPPKATDWSSVLRVLLGGLLALLLLVLIFLLAFFGWRYVNDYQFAEPVKVESSEVQFKPEEFKLNKRISTLEGRNSWLRKLLRDSKRELRVAKENLATKEARIRNLRDQKTQDEKYHEFLKYALDQFYAQPFKKGEGQRSICFTTDTYDRSCYQIVRPDGWRVGDPMPRPVRVNQP